MNNFIKRLGILLSVLFLTSCLPNLQDITITGKIIDKQTNQPIANAEVAAISWYDTSIYDGTYELKETTTDSAGNYELKFDLGYQINVASKTKEHNPNKSFIELKENTLTVDLSLKQKKNSNSLVVNLTTADNVFDEVVKTPYLRHRFYSIPNTNKLDFTRVEIWGYDFKNSKNTSSCDSADIWLEGTNKEEHSTILLTGPNGGLIPIFDTDITSSLLFEKTEAPTNGYLTEYQLKGTEAGFFIKCRDGVTFGKLIMEKSKVDRSSPCEKGYFKEWGYNFSSMYQVDSSRFFNYYQDIELEQFMVDYRYR